MSFRVPGLELHLPLRARPISGAVTGAVTGLALGFLHSLSENPEGGATALSGLVGGFFAGLLIGVALPLFAKRWLGGSVVGVAATIGLAATFPRWGDRGWFIYPFIGALGAIVYGVLLWERPKPANVVGVKPGEPDATIDSRDA